jgi:hypothetical protein
MATEAEKRGALDRAIVAELTRGGRLESSAGMTAVIVYGKPVNHILHLVLSLLTGGIWLIVWLILILTNRKRRVVLSVDESGQVMTTTAQA